MMRIPILALLPIAALAACAHDQNMTVASIHQPVVATSDMAITLGGDARGLNAGEAQRLSGYLAGIGLSRGDLVSTDAPAGPARDAIALALGESGILLAPDGPAGPPASGGYRVVISRASVSVSGCPDWTQSQIPPSTAAVGRNYGCATNATLAAMLDDPRDLIRGRDAGTAVDPRMSVRAIKIWREAVPTGQAALSRAITQETAAGGAGAR